MILNGNKRAEVMKNIYKIAVLLSVVTFAVSGCVEENMEPTIPAKDGDEIIFGARAGFENATPETKTVYDVIDKAAKYQKIMWVPNTDKVEVYCPQAINGPTSHYVVVGDAEKTEYASLKRTGDSSLQWNGDDTHDFYAMYPSSNMFDANEGFEGVSMTESLIKGVVPSEQSPVSVAKDGDNWILNPDMRFAYMAARGSANRYTQTETGTVQNGISLTFMPIVTAVEFQMVLPKDTPDLELTEIWLEGSGIAGDFQCDLTDWDGSSCPPCADTNPVNRKDIIQVSTWQTESGKQVPMTISANATLSFTVFMHPAADISDLKITLYNGAAKVSKTLKKDSAPIIKKQKKTFIKNLSLPGELSEVNEENWMGQIDPETEFNRLSLPGASGAFTQNGGEGYCSQSLSFADLWKAGIRAFEISTDRVKITDVEFDFGDCKVLCNNQPVGDETVETVLSKIDNCLSANGNECAVLILTYQPTGALFYPRDPETYMEEVCKYFTNNYNGKLVKYSPNLKLSQVRGKIIVIVRPTQRDEDNATERDDALKVVEKSAVNDKILVVDGCGTAKDKWYARGYSYNGTRSPEQGKYQSRRWASGIEQAIAGGSDSNWGNVKKVPADFSYNVNLSKEENYQVWYQEWARVVPDSKEIGKDDGITNYGGYHWQDSYNEKLADVKTAYEMAMSGNYDGVDENGQPSASEPDQYVFINSLSGFYLSTTSGFELSYRPLDPSSSTFYNGGSKGDIKGLANDLNEDFYQYILGKQKEGKVGATGIVMMDFVSNSLDENHPGSYYLPSVIIKNNIKYNGQKN